MPYEAAGAQEAAAAENLLARCEPVEYQHVHTTLVYGLLDPAYLFGSGRVAVAELNGEITSTLTLTQSPNPKP